MTQALSILASPTSIDLDYPAHNRFDVPLEYVPLKFDVLSICDFRSGYPVDWLIRRPLVRRSRYLITGFDQLANSRRTIWYESRKGGALPEWRLGLYDPNEPCAAIDWVGRIFTATADEQLRMRKVALKWLRLVKERGDVGMKLAVYPGVW